jgi:hypothetical protein
VLREALCVRDPEALFGPAKETWEVRDGEFVVIPAKQRVVAPRESLVEPVPVPL